MPSLNGVQPSIRVPGMDANNFELKPSLIQMVQSNDQFRGTGEEDPIMHLTNFMELCGTLKMNGISDDAIKLRLFPFSLRDKALLEKLLFLTPKNCYCNPTITLFGLLRATMLS